MEEREIIGTVSRKLEGLVGKVLEETLPQTVEAYMKGLIQETLRSVPSVTPQEQARLIAIQEEAVATIRKHARPMGNALTVSLLAPLQKLSATLKPLIQRP